MRKVKVYFEIYGKKLKVVLEIPDDIDPKEKVKNDIIFHKVEELPQNDIPDFLKDIFNRFQY